VTPRPVVYLYAEAPTTGTVPTPDCLEPSLQVSRTLQNSCHNGGIVMAREEEALVIRSRQKSLATSYGPSIFTHTVQVKPHVSRQTAMDGQIVCGCYLRTEALVAPSKTVLLPANAKAWGNKRGSVSGGSERSHIGLEGQQGWAEGNMVDEGARLDIGIGGGGERRE